MFAELPITIADGAVWLSIGQGLLVGAVCLLFGVWVARFVGLLGADAPAGETLGVGLASGLLVLTAVVGRDRVRRPQLVHPGRGRLRLAIGLAAVAAAASRPRRRRRAGRSAARPMTPGRTVAASAGSGTSSWPSSAARVFVVAVALLYGSTMAPSPRDGVQPLEFMDEAYYSVLGADLAKTGTEIDLLAVGLHRDRRACRPRPGTTGARCGWARPRSRCFGTAPLDARHLVVLPLMLLAAAALTGTLVRRMTGSTSRGAFLFGFARLPLPRAGAAGASA